MTRQRDQYYGYHGGGRDPGDMMSGLNNGYSARFDDNGQHSGKGGGRERGGGGSSSAPVSPLEDLMRRKGIDEAWNALEEMQRQGISTDRFTISRMLMKTVGDGRSRWNPSKVYRGMGLVEGFIQLQPEEADEVLFNALLDTCCRMKDLSRLESTVKRMHELQIHPSHVTLGILVKAYGQAGDVSRVLKIWEEMAEQRRQANAVTFGCMIDACVKCGHMDKAIEIFYDMKRRRKHRNTILYTTLIKGYGLEKDLPHALELFKEMQEEGVPYNTITYNSIIDVCIKCCDVQTAEGLLREMLSSGSSVEPDLITYSTLLKGYCHVGDLDRALQVAETIKVRGLKCDELVYNTLMDGCVKANDLSAGIGLFAEMTQAGMRPSSITHSILVRLYQRNGYKGDSLDAVAQLYQHHGLDRPNLSIERGRGGRRGDFARSSHLPKQRERHDHRGANAQGHDGPRHLGMQAAGDASQRDPGMHSMHGGDPQVPLQCHGPPPYAGRPDAGLAHAHQHHGIGGLPLHSQARQGCMGNDFMMPPYREPPYRERELEAIGGRPTYAQFEDAPWSRQHEAREHGLMPPHGLGGGMPQHGHGHPMAPGRQVPYHSGAGASGVGGEAYRGYDGHMPRYGRGEEDGRGMPWGHEGHYPGHHADYYGEGPEGIHRMSY